LHNPTWFSSSIEFKERDVRKALKQGWHSWERERVPNGRRRVLPQESLTTEALLAFTPEHFLRSCPSSCVEAVFLGGKKRRESLRVATPQETSREATNTIPSTRRYRFRDPDARRLPT